MWYKRLRDFLIDRGFKNDEVCPCIFIKRTHTKLFIVDVYVDDLNIIGMAISEIVSRLKGEFEMKDFGKTTFCLSLQIEHLAGSIFLHQSLYTRKLFKRFSMDAAHPLSSPMVVRSLDPEKDEFRPCDEGETCLGPETPYLAAISALMYLANCTRPDIAFVVNLLARFSAKPTKRHWNGVKHILRYLKGTKDLGLFYKAGEDSNIK
jgi:hypothetical protein